MATWLSFAPWVRTMVPGCPDPVIERAVCDAAIEFCEITHAFVEQVTFTTQVGVSSYEVVSEEGVPAMVLSAKLGTRPLSPVYLESLENSLGDSWRLDIGTPQHFLADFEDQLRVYPTPTASETGTMTIAVRPSRGDTSWDDRLYERYGEVIADGALYRLLGQTATPWADQNASLMRRQRFLQGSNRVRAKVYTSFSPATLHVNF